VKNGVQETCFLELWEGHAPKPSMDFAWKKKTS